MAFAAATSIATIGLYISYTIPILITVIWPQLFERGPFTLGKFSRPIGAVACLWVRLTQTQSLCAFFQLTLLGRLHHRRVLPADYESRDVADTQLYARGCWHRWPGYVWLVVSLGAPVVHRANQADRGGAGGHRYRRARGL